MSNESPKGILTPEADPMEPAWATLYQAITHHGDVMERMYACLGRMLTIKQQSPDNLALLAECESTMSFLLEQSGVAKATMAEARARYDETIRSGGRTPLLMFGKNSPGN